jgi:hypothetical protein
MNEAYGTHGGEPKYRKQFAWKTELEEPLERRGHRLKDNTKWMGKE